LSYAIINVDNGNAPLVEHARSTPVQALAAGFFTADGTGHGPPAATAVRVRSDGTQAPVSVFACSSAGSCTAVPLDLNADGTVYLSLYGTGFGAADSVGCIVGRDQIEVPVSYSGPQKVFPGLDQLNLKLPKTLPSGALTVECQFGLQNHVVLRSTASAAIMIK
jgi:uncharacterized protein (TIGR03437 family)